MHNHKHYKSQALREDSSLKVDSRRNLVGSMVQYERNYVKLTLVPCLFS